VTRITDEDSPDLRNCTSLISCGLLSWSRMDFTFIRPDRSQEDNQERAFVAASRRQDRDYYERLGSLGKASNLHCARTGKVFDAIESQVTHNGPLIEVAGSSAQERQSAGPPHDTLRREVPQGVEYRAPLLQNELNTMQQLQTPSQNQTATTEDFMNRSQRDGGQDTSSLEVNHVPQGSSTERNTGESAE
jgi:hypothetical protein